MGDNRRGSSPEPVRVLFVNTRSALGADVAVHLSLIQSFAPDQVLPFIVTNGTAPDLNKTLAELQQLPKDRVLVRDLGRESAGKGGRLARAAGQARSLAALSALRELSRFVRSNRIDVIHSTDRPRDVLFSTLLARITRRPNVVHLHIKWYPEIGGLTTRALKSCSAAVAISDFVKRSMVEGGIPAASITRIYNATDAARFDPAKVKRGVLRTKFGMEPDTPLVGIVARVMIWKGQLELVEAFSSVKRRVPNARLVIIGEEDKLAVVDAHSYAAQVRERIAALGLQESVIWAGWQDDMPGVMADLDVLAMPSWEEPFGLAVTEAMAMERPVVGFCSGALPEIIRDGMDGRLTPLRDAEALGDAISDLLLDPTTRREMGHRARERVAGVFTPQRQAREMGDLYRSLMVVKTKAR